MRPEKSCQGHYGLLSGGGGWREAGTSPGHRGPEVIQSRIWNVYVNNHGLASTFVKRPHPSDVELLGFRTGTINLDLNTGDASNTLVELDEVFAIALSALNTARTDGPWRIAYARGINDAGHIACQLIPASEPRLLEDTIPCLLAVGDLSRRDSADGLTLVTEEARSQDFWQLNQNGDVLISVSSSADTLLLREVDAFGAITYVSAFIPSPTVAHYAHKPTINSARTACYGDVLANPLETVLYRYSVATGNESVLWRSREPRFSSPAIAEDNNAYVMMDVSETTGQGKNQTTTYFSAPYHIISESERTPLSDYQTEGSVEILNRWSQVSSAPISGEEEVVLTVEESGRYQVYKPNFSARFELPIAPGSALRIAISAPYNDHLQSSPQSYHGGYVAYMTDAGAPRCFILSPSS